jgi:hypothetical protein
MLNSRHRLVWFVSVLLISLGIAVASPSPVSAANDTGSATCGTSTGRQSTTAGSGDTLTITATGTCLWFVNKQLVAGAAQVAGFTDSSCSVSAGAAADGGTEWTYAASANVACVVVTLGGSGTGTGQINVIDAGFDGAFWSFTAFDGTVSGGGGGGGGGGGSSSTGCEVAGKPCAVRPWPWAVARTDHVILSWEALIDAEAGTGGVTSYRVESTPAGGTCILRLSEVAAGESLPTTCNITGLETDTDYTFTVYASSASGEGPGRSTQEAVRLLAAATPAVTVPAVTPETPAPMLPATGQHTVLVGAAVLLIGLGALATLSVRRRRDLSLMAQAVRHP